MKILVTGGAGFIGSHVVDIFIKEGHKVVVIDNLCTGKRKNVNEKAKLYLRDICSKGLSEIFKQEKPDVVCHHAAQINVRDSIKDPVLDSKINILGSINLLECCKEHNVKHFIYASSGGAIYGEPEQLPCDENHSIKPLSPYGASKYAVELLLHYYFTACKIRYTSLRYANVYGPRQEGGEAGVVSIFINNMLNGKNCIINGKGEQTRDFIYVEDIAKANLLALNSTNNNLIINVGKGEQISIIELFKKIQSIIGSDIECEFGPEIKGEVERIFLSNNLAKEMIGWEPSIKLDEGLKRTVEWFK